MIARPRWSVKASGDMCKHPSVCAGLPALAPGARAGRPAQTLGCLHMSPLALTLHRGRAIIRNRPDFGRAHQARQPPGVLRYASHHTPGGAEPPGRQRFEPSVNTKPTYLSREGETGLRQELDTLVNVRRAEVAARIH